MGTNLDAPCAELHAGVVWHERILHQLCQHMPSCVHHVTQVNALTLGGPKPHLGMIGVTSPRRACSPADMYQRPCQSGIALLESHFSQAFKIKTCCQGTDADD